MEAMQTEMPRYRSHKEVWALKIKNLEPLPKDEDSDGGGLLIPEEEGYAPIKISSAYIQKHKPYIGGYYVRYKDGYESFSPAEAFEEGNTRIS